jgi:hypothetical protein
MDKFRTVNAKKRTMEGKNNRSLGFGSRLRQPNFRPSHPLGAQFGPLIGQSPGAGPLASPPLLSISSPQGKSQDFDQIPLWLFLRGPCRGI